MRWLCLNIHFSTELSFYKSFPAVEVKLKSLKKKVNVARREVKKGGCSNKNLNLLVLQKNTKSLLKKHAMLAKSSLQ